MKIIEDGNFTSWFRYCLFISGISLGLGGLAIESLHAWIRLALIFLGVGLAAAGGFAAKAHALKLRPFDNSYKKARDSYKEKDDSST